MISMDKKYTTRDGRPTRVICIDYNNNNEHAKVIALVTMPDDQEVTFYYSTEGRLTQREEHYLDLIEVKNKKSGWINLWIVDETRTVPVGPIYPTKEIAESRGHLFKNYNLQTIFIEWEE